MSTKLQWVIIPSEDQRPLSSWTSFNLSSCGWWMESDKQILIGREAIDPGTVCWRKENTFNGCLVDGVICSCEHALFIWDGLLNTMHHTAAFSVPYNAREFTVFLNALLGPFNVIKCSMSNVKSTIVLKKNNDEEQCCTCCTILCKTYQVWFVKLFSYVCKWCENHL